MQRADTETERPSDIAHRHILVPLFHDHAKSAGTQNFFLQNRGTTPSTISHAHTVDACNYVIHLISSV